MPGAMPSSTSAPDTAALAFAPLRDWHPPMLP
jgi:hypothetical protein